jgi:predicted ATPase
MLERLILENFKAFAGRHVIPFGRLTLIFGRNSSGKSSILQSLAFLKQSSISIKEKQLTLSKGFLVDLGSGKQILNGQNDRFSSEIATIFTKDIVEHSRFLPMRAARPTSIRALPRTLGIGHVLTLNKSDVELSVPQRNIYGESNDFFCKKDSFTLNIPLDRGAVDVNPDSGQVRALYDMYRERLSIFYEENLAAWRELMLEALNTPEGAELVEALSAAGDDFFRERADDRQSEDESITITSVIAQGRFDQPPTTTDGSKRRKSLLLTNLIFRVLEGRGAQTSPLPITTLRLALESAFERVRRTYTDLSLEQFAIELNEIHRSIARYGSLNRLYAGGDEPTNVVAELRVATPLVAAWAAIRDGVDDAISNLRYIGPVRWQGNRYDEVRAVPNGDVGKSGQNTVQLLVDDPDLRDRTNAWMDRFGIAYHLEPQKLETGRGAPILDARILDARNDLELNLVDVGFGISQVVPVIVQSLLLLSNSGTDQGRRDRCDTVLIEQPELHLHPAMQAELGSLFADVINASSTAQIIAETHSEALILRVMKLIRTRQLNASDVKVLWVDQDPDGNAFHRDLPIDASGEFEVPWPRGFFSDRYLELDD